MFLNKTEFSVYFRKNDLLPIKFQSHCPVLDYSLHEKGEFIEIKTMVEHCGKKIRAAHKSLNFLHDNFVQIEEPQEIIASGGYFEGKKCVLTGTLSSLSIKQAEELIEAQGGTTYSSVTGATNIVIVGEDAGSKYDKAKKLGIQIMYESEFLEKINN